MSDALPTAPLPPVLRTARLALRPFADADAEDLMRIFGDPEVVRYWSTGAWTDIAQAEAMIAEARQAYRDGGLYRYAIALRDTDRLIGVCNLRGFFEQNRRCELGYALARGHWGQGYAAEALEALLGHAFTNSTSTGSRPTSTRATTPRRACSKSSAFAARAPCPSAGSCTATRPIPPSMACSDATGTSARGPVRPPTLPLEP